MVDNVKTIPYKRIKNDPKTKITEINSGVHMTYQSAENYMVMDTAKF